MTPDKPRKQYVLQTQYGREPECLACGIIAPDGDGDGNYEWDLLAIPDITDDNNHDEPRWFWTHTSHINRSLEIAYKTLREQNPLYQMPDIERVA